MSPGFLSSFNRMNLKCSLILKQIGLMLRIPRIYYNYKIALAFFSLFFIANVAGAQTTETFETETVGATSFSNNGKTFTITNTPSAETFDIEPFTNGGWNGSSTDNQFIDNSGSGAAGNMTGDGTSFTLATSDASDFSIKSLYLFVTTRALSFSHGGTVTIAGRENGVLKFTIVKSSGFASSLATNNGFTFIDFSTEGGSNNSNTPIDELIISSSGNADYLALDAFTWDLAVAPSTATVAATAFIEGAYNGTNLNTTLNTSIPTAQPYSTNGHVGAETVGSIPANAVDWVLVELREASSAAAALSSTRVGSAAGFLMNDGTIKATDGTSNLTVSLSGNSGADFYVVIYHRNHLPIMSANAISESSSVYTIDFTSASANTHQGTTGLASLSGGKFAMIAGDANGDGSVNATDITLWKVENGDAFSYSITSSDFNLDGEINAIDLNDFQKKNESKSSQVPNS